MNLPTNIDEAQLPQVYEAAHTALAECEQIDECKDWADKAAAMASYAKQAKDDSLMKMAMRINARAWERAGSILEQITPQKGGDRRSDQKAVAVPLVTRKSIAKEAGLSERQAKTALRIAAVPKEEFDRQVESDNPPTVSNLAEQGTKKREVVDQSHLRGRTEKQFNIALHFTAELRDAAVMIGKLKTVAIPYLNPRQSMQCREDLAKIITTVQKIEGEFPNEQFARESSPQHRSKAA